jgi:hypothetical protein
MFPAFTAVCMMACTPQRIAVHDAAVLAGEVGAAVLVGSCLIVVSWDVTQYVCCMWDVGVGVEWHVFPPIRMFVRLHSGGAGAAGLQ